MADLSKLSSYLEKSIYTPLLDSDPCYIAIKAELTNILNQVVSELSYSSVEEVPKEDENVLLLLAKKEVYWRLATATAPSYDVEFEFTKLAKSKRFDHYYKLIVTIQSELDSNQYSSKIQVADVTMRSRDGSARNYALAQNVSTGLTIVNTTKTSADISWIAFNTAKGTLLCYELLVGTEPLYDEFAEPVVDYNKADQTVVIPDVKKTKYRLLNLTENTLYYAVIVYKAQSGTRYYSTATFSTKEV